jgi:hypothetical protein
MTITHDYHDNWWPNQPETSAIFVQVACPLDCSTRGEYVHLTLTGLVGKCTGNLDMSWGKHGETRKTCRCSLPIGMWFWHFWLLYLISWSKIELWPWHAEVRPKLLALRLSQPPLVINKNKKKLIMAHHGRQRSSSTSQLGCGGAHPFHKRSIRNPYLRTSLIALKWSSWLTLQKIQLNTVPWHLVLKHVLTPHQLPIHPNILMKYIEIPWGQLYSLFQVQFYFRHQCIFRHISAINFGIFRPSICEPLWILWPINPN